MSLFLLLLYLFLCPEQKSDVFDCKQKLKRINYTFEYNNDPAYCDAAFYRYGGCYCKDPHEKKAYVQKIVSFYTCFNKVLKTDATKVLLITHRSETPTGNKLLNTAIKCYDLDVDRTFFAYNKKQSKAVKIELLEQGHPKLKSKNIIAKEQILKALERCTVCSF